MAADHDVHELQCRFNNVKIVYAVYITLVRLPTEFGDVQQQVLPFSTLVTRTAMVGRSFPVM